jgi:hypothetical protein
MKFPAPDFPFASAQNLGRYVGRDGKTRDARQRKAAELFFEGVN